jgi:hypothetical protein
MQDGGNVGIGTTSPEVHPTDPSGNLDVNDVYLRSTSQWLSAGGGGGGLAFGNWQNTDIGQIGGTDVTLTKNTVYHAATDGFVVAHHDPCCAYGSMRGFTDSVDASTLRFVDSGDETATYGIMMPVKEGDYWKVTFSPAIPTIYWIPVVSGGGGGGGGGGGWVFDETFYPNRSIPETSWYNLDLSAKVGNKRTLVLLKVKGPAAKGQGFNRGIQVKPYNDPDDFETVWGEQDISQVHLGAHGYYEFVMTTTDNNGHIGLRSTAYGTVSWDIKLVGYIG